MAATASLPPGLPVLANASAPTPAADTPAARLRYQPPKSPVRSRAAGSHDCATGWPAIHALRWIRGRRSRASVRHRLLGGTINVKAGTRVCSISPAAAHQVGPNWNSQMPACSHPLDQPAGILPGVIQCGRTIPGSPDLPYPSAGAIIRGTAHNAAWVALIFHLMRPAAARGAKFTLSRISMFPLKGWRLAHSHE